MPKVFDYDQPDIGGHRFYFCGREIDPDWIILALEALRSGEPCHIDDAGNLVIARVADGLEEKIGQTLTRGSKE